MAARDFLEQHHNLQKNIQQLQNMYEQLSNK
jgi:hypothetical protein